MCVEGVGSHLFGLLGSPSLPRTLSTHVQFRAQTEASWDLCLSQGMVWGKSLPGQFWIAQRVARVGSAREAVGTKALDQAPRCLVQGSERST